jgi:hypothetical protein
MVLFSESGRLPRRSAGEAVLIMGRCLATDSLSDPMAFARWRLHQVPHFAEAKIETADWTEVGERLFHCGWTGRSTQACRVLSTIRRGLGVSAIAVISQQRPKRQTWGELTGQLRFGFWNSPP